MVLLSLMRQNFIEFFQFMHGLVATILWFGLLEYFGGEILRDALLSWMAFTRLHRFTILFFCFFVLAMMNERGNKVCGKVVEEWNG